MPIDTGLPKMILRCYFAAFQCREMMEISISNFESEKLNLPREMDWKTTGRKYTPSTTTIALLLIIVIQLAVIVMMTSARSESINSCTISQSDCVSVILLISWIKNLKHVCQRLELTCLTVVSVCQELVIYIFYLISRLILQVENFPTLLNPTLSELPLERHRVSCWIVVSVVIVAAVVIVVIVAAVIIVVIVVVAVIAVAVVAVGI